MKAILFSSDFEGLDATKELEKLVGKPAKEINFAIINEAANVLNVDSKREINDNSFFVDGMHFIKHHFGNFDLVNLLALTESQVKQRMEKADVIFCFGGNTEYLQYIFDKTGFSKLVPELLKTKVWCGSSAGSMILGRMIPHELQLKLYGDDWDTYDTDKYLDLLDFSVLAHLRGGDLANDPRDKAVFDISKECNWDIYALSDWSAVVVDGSETKVIGKYWSKLRNGKIIEGNRE